MIYLYDYDHITDGTDILDECCFAVPDGTCGRGTDGTVYMPEDIERDERWYAVEDADWPAIKVRLDATARPYDYLVTDGLPVATLNTNSEMLARQLDTDGDTVRAIGNETWLDAIDAAHKAGRKLGIVVKTSDDFRAWNGGRLYSRPGGKDHGNGTMHITDGERYEEAFEIDRTYIAGLKAAVVAIAKAKAVTL